MDCRLIFYPIDKAGKVWGDGGAEGAGGGKWSMTRKEFYV